MRAIATQPVSFFRPLRDSIAMGARVGLGLIWPLYRSAVKPPPWIMKLPMTRWKIVPA